MFSGGVKEYRRYTGELYNIKADKNQYGKSINGSRKKKVAAYISGLDISDAEKYILFKLEYPGDDSHNMEIIDYLNGRKDMSYSEKKRILEDLGFKVDSEGYIDW